jgi:hypothetical protein
MASAGYGTYLQTGTFPVRAPCFRAENAHVSLEYTMNIFYIIGVIVVVLFVAGFLGLHA